MKVENTKETVAEESVNTADETAEKSAEAVSEENTEGLENADRSESAEEKKTFSTETETPVENLENAYTEYSGFYEEYGTGRD